MHIFIALQYDLPYWYIPLLTFEFKEVSYQRTR